MSETFSHFCGMKTQHLTTARDVMEALGGYREVASLASTRHRRVAWGTSHHWGRINQFPPRLYLCMTAALRTKGFTAPASLWGQDEIEMRATQGSIALGA